MTTTNSIPAVHRNNQAGLPPQSGPADFLRTAKAALWTPRSFFAGINYNGGLYYPFVFLACCALIHAMFVGLTLKKWAFVALSLINGIIFPFITAGFLYFIASRIFKGKGSYGAAFKVNAYAAATSLFSWIPLGGFLLEIYRIYLVGLGLGHAFCMKPFAVTMTIVFTLIIYILMFSGLSHLAGILLA